MKDFIVSFLEGIIVGVAMSLVIILLDIDMTTTQIIVLIAVACVSASVASSIGNLIKKGKDTVYYEWVFKHGDNRIEITAGLVERLYIDDILVDENQKVKLNKVELHGKLKTGEDVKAIIVGGMTMKCELFVDNKQLQPTLTKKP